ncbi:MAG: hypothetical protein M3342_00830 [Bacteroidota bacterium]|nr:hypothetical protein [Bacteroidota bacterium]
MANGSSKHAQDEFEFDIVECQAIRFVLQLSGGIVVQVSIKLNGSFGAVFIERPASNCCSMKSIKLLIRTNVQ